MKNQVLLSFLNDTKLFDIQSLAFFEGKFVWSKSTIAYSLILTFHPKIKEDFQKIQNSFKPFSPYPEPRTMDSVIEILHQWSSEEDRKKLNDEVALRIKKYNLGEVWEIPLKMKVITGVLPVPYDSPKISFSFPSQFKGGLVGAANRFLGYDIIETRRRIKYPCIVITEDIKPNQLNKFITKNWKNNIKPVLSKLPKRKFIDVDIDRLALGVWIFIRKDLSGKTWDDIDNEITKITEREQDFFGDVNSTPSRTDLQKILDDTKNYFRQIYPL